MKSFCFIEYLKLLYFLIKYLSFDFFCQVE